MTFKYSPGYILRHHRKGTLYRIVKGERSCLRMAGSGEPAYGYTRMGEPLSFDNPVWIREQSAIEDPEKFVRVKLINSQWVEVL